MVAAIAAWLAVAQMPRWDPLTCVIAKKVIRSKPLTDDEIAFRM